MTQTGYETGPATGTQTKIYVRTDLMEWLDREAERRQRSRGFLINEAIAQRMQRLAKGRQRSQRVRAGGRPEA